MASQAGSIVKILLLSTGLSLMVKYGGRLLPIPATTTVVLIAITFPVFAISLALLWRTQNQRKHLN